MDRKHHPSDSRKPAPAPMEKPKDTPPSANGRQTVLIIDDEKDVHYSFRRLLEREPLEILSAASGDEGIKMARKSLPDLIVMESAWASRADSIR
jgi:response regulator RpfG family c-di-GMP phosphodiesterase